MAVLLAGDWLHVAWLGDSQAMLVRQGDPVTLMDPHKPEREVSSSMATCKRRMSAFLSFPSFSSLMSNFYRATGLFQHLFIF